jgi:hypothetical protein
MCRQVESVELEVDLQPVVEGGQLGEEPVVLHDPDAIRVE